MSKQAAVFWAIVLVLFCFTSIGHCGNIAVAPIPSGEAVCEDFQVFVDGQNLPVYSCRVSAMPFNQIWAGYQRPLDQTELSGFAYWEMKGEVQVTIDCTTEVKTAIVRPSALGITPKTNGSRITFSLKSPGPIVVEVNDKHHVLHLFPSKMRTTKIDPNQPGLHYFGPGVHRPGIIRPKNGESVYIDAGAVVYGGILCEDASDVIISGRGILDAGVLERGNPKFPSINNLRFNRCRNIKVDGIILRDSNNFGCDMRTCENMTVSNIFLIGFWRYNADGIDACNCKNIQVRGCFVRSFDDSLVVKGLWPEREHPSENIRYERCVVWCDWGKGMEIGASSYISGFDEEHGFKRVCIENLRFNDQKPVETAEEMKLEIGKYVSDVQIVQ